MLTDLKPKKSLGQNWLTNPRILEKIISAAEITGNDIVLEIGPGLGSLTERLSRKAGTVIAVEKDHRLIGFLKEKFKNQANVKLIESDILKFDPAMVPVVLQWAPLQSLRPRNYKIIGNIPYYITSNLLRVIFEKWPKPEVVVFTVQKEVAQRIIAKPPHMNLLALSIQYYAGPEIISYISKNNFKPIPKVDSAIIRLKPKSLNLDPEETTRFFKLIRAGFAGKRKQLINSLVHNLKRERSSIENYMKKAGIDPKSRPEELVIESWIKLIHLMS